MIKKTAPLMVFCLLFFLAYQLEAQDEDTTAVDTDKAAAPKGTTAVNEGPQLMVSAEVLNDNPVQNEPFAVSIMVDHPNPAEVRVQPPDFEDKFTMERVRTEVRLIRDISNEERRWTAFEFLLIPLQAGNVPIGSFEVAVPGRTVATNYLRVRVKPSFTAATSKLKWIGNDVWSKAPSSIAIGKTGSAALQLMDWDRTKPYPSDLPLWIEAPENAIIQDEPVPMNERERGVVFRLRFVPFDEKPINIAGYTFRYEGRTLEVPPLSIVVLPEEVPAADSSVTAELAAETQIQDEGQGAGKAARLPRFPVGSFGNSGFLPRSVEQTVDAAQDLWQEKRYSESLARLRKAEREFVWGFMLTALRREAETVLGLPQQPNEKWQPAALYLAVVGVSLLGLVLFSISALVFKKKNIVFFTLLSLVFVSSCILLVVLKWDDGKKAVMKDTLIAPVPENGQTPSGFIMEGQNVSVRSKPNGVKSNGTVSNSWIYIESYDGKAGWVHGDRAVFY